MIKIKITDKVSVLVLFLLCVLAANTFVGLNRIIHMRSAFVGMAECDVGFMEAVTSIEQNHMAQAILVQKLIGIAEELGFEQQVFARHQYLLDQITSMREGVDHYAALILADIESARRALNRSMEAAGSDQKRQQLRQALAGLERIEEVRNAYEKIIAQMTAAMSSGGFQLSLDDLEMIQRQDKAITAQVQSLMKDVQGFVHDSLAQAGYWQQHTQKTLLLVLILSIIISIVFAWWIVRGIARPLQALGDAAREVGKGKLSVQLDTSSKDEIAQVAQAFNTMAAELEKSNAELERVLHTASHEILGPLTVIVGYAAYLEKNYEGVLDEKGKESLNNLRKSASRLTVLVKDLVATAKVLKPH